MSLLEHSKESNLLLYQNWPNREREKGKRDRQTKRESKRVSGTQVVKVKRRCGFSQVHMGEKNCQHKTLLIIFS